MSAPTLRDLTRVSLHIGLASFGGPAAQIALMHKELVEDRGWLSEDDYLRALSFCMLLPGPEAMQLATYAGWKTHGLKGGLIAGALFVIPGACVILALALAYASWGKLPFVEAAFLGIKATVLIIVLQALLKIAKRAIKKRAHLWIAAASFIALFFLNAPFPLIILLAGIVGYFMKSEEKVEAVPLPDMSQTLRIIAIGGALWATPIVLAIALGASFLTEIGLFFSKLAVVTFGGAYSVLAYMSQEVVAHHGWISSDQMIDALGLAETTPGPLILVTEFVGVLSGLAQGGITLALLAGALTLWVTFIPCFIWIFAGAPLIDWLSGQPRLSSALSAITAAVLGVILNLSLWFGAHVLFASVGRTNLGLLQFLRPDLASLNLAALGLTLLAAALMLWRKWGMLRTLPVMALLGLGMGQLALF